jgi:putative acetyltransferase
LINRTQTAADAESVDALLRESFPTDAEADLAKRLQMNGDAIIALLGEDNSQIQAYAMFSKVDAPFRALGLGPVATNKTARNQGHASALIRNGLEMARADGWQACFVLGNPKFYGRLGFSVELARGFRCKYAGPNFMCIGLQSGGLPTLSGAVAYAKAFG